MPSAGSRAPTDAHDPELPCHSRRWPRAPRTPPALLRCLRLATPTRNYRCAARALKCRRAYRAGPASERHDRPAAHHEEPALRRLAHWRPRLLVIVDPPAGPWPAGKPALVRASRSALGIAPEVGS